jgi:hypothetical protein
MEDAFAETLPCSTPEPSIITFPATIELCNKIDPMQNPTSGWPDWTVFNLLGDCLHTYLCSFLNYRSRPIFGILFSVVICSYVLILTKNGPGNILGDFLQQLIWSPCPTYTHETVEPFSAHFCWTLAIISKFQPPSIWKHVRQKVEFLFRK